MHLPAVVIGAGHAGLAMSRRLTERSIDHVVIERGEVANSWRTERWDSLRLLTPNWHARLPGAAGDDGAMSRSPDGYMTVGEVAALVDRYATTIDAPVVDRTTVTRLGPRGDGYEVVTDRGVWTCAAAIIASGGCAAASVPPFAAALPPSITSVTPLAYRNPRSLPDGGVLVVGASATGVQLAEEISASGRPVTLAVGEHVRMPRTYRSRDIFWWTETAGILDERYDEVDDLVRARHLPSPQLIGTPERRSIDLDSLRAAGVRIAGRLGRIDDGIAQFSGSLANVCALADLKLDRLLRTLDDAATTMGFEEDIGPPERFPPTSVSRSPVSELDLAAEGIRTVIWATGYRPDHRWVDLAVFDHKGRIRHDGGVVDGAAGLYVLGLNVLRRRRSSFIGGAAGDTEELADHLHGHLDLTTETRPRGARPPGERTHEQDDEHGLRGRVSASGRGKELLKRTRPDGRARLGLASRGVVLGERGVPLGLQPVGKLGTALLHDPALDQDVHDVGAQLGQQAVVVGDRQHAEPGPVGRGLRHRFDATGAVAQGVDVEA